MSAADGIATKVIAGATIEVIERGSGRPLLFLHPGIGIDPGAAVLERLAQGARVIAPLASGLRPLGTAAGDDDGRRPRLFLSRSLRDATILRMRSWSASPWAAGSPPRSR